MHIKGISASSDGVHQLRDSVKTQVTPPTSVGGHLVLPYVAGLRPFVSAPVPAAPIAPRLAARDRSARKRRGS